MAIKTLRGVDAVVKARPAEKPGASKTTAKAKAKANIKDALEELKLYRKGELQFQPAEALLEEL